MPASDNPPAAPLVGIIMGSKSDWPTMRGAAAVLGELGIACESRIVSAHRTPDLMADYAKAAAGRGLLCIIAGGGGGGHLPGGGGGGASAGDGGGAYGAAGDWRAGEVACAGGAGFAVVDRADAGGDSGGD